MLSFAIRASVAVLLALAATGCGDKTVAPQGIRPIVSWRTHGSPESIAISHDGNILAVHMGTRVMFYRAASGDSLSDAPIYWCPYSCVLSPSNVAFSPNDSEVAAGATSQLFFIGAPSGVLRDSVAVGYPFTLFTGVEYDPMGRFVYVMTQLGDVSVFDPTTGALILKHPNDYPDFLPWTLMPSPDGTTLAVGGNIARRQAIRLYDINDFSHYETLLGDSGFVVNLVFDKSGNRLFSGALFSRSGGPPIYGRATCWDIPARRPLWTRSSTNLFVFTMDISPDATLLASSWLDGQLVLMDARTGNPLRRWPGHTEAGTFDLAFFPDGHALVSSGYDNTIKEWDVAEVLNGGEAVASMDDYGIGTGFGDLANTRVTRTFALLTNTAP